MRQVASHVKYRQLQVCPDFTPSLAPRTTVRAISRNSAIAKGLRSDISAASRLPYKPIKEDGLGDRKDIFRRSALAPAKKAERVLETLRYNTKPALKPLVARKGSEIEHLKGYFPIPVKKDRFPVREPSLDKRNEETDDWSRNVPLPIPYATAASVHICGARAVLSALSAGRRTIYKCYMANAKESTSPDLEIIASKVRAAGITVEVVGSAFLDNLARRTLNKFDALTPIHDGVVVDASPIPQTPISCLGLTSRQGGFFELDVAAQNKEEVEVNGTSNRVKYAGQNGRQPLLLWLHGVTNVGNFGAILRSALYFGIDGMILSDRETVTMHPGSVRASVGAAEFLPIFTATLNPVTFMQKSQENGWDFYATVAPEQSGRGPLKLSTLQHSPLARKPCVLVFGNEDAGLPKYLVKGANHRITIDGQSVAAKEAGIDSLNVSVAAALLIERFLRQSSTLAADAGRDVPAKMETNQLF